MSQRKRSSSGSVVSQRAVAARCDNPIQAVVQNNREQTDTAKSGHRIVHMKIVDSKERAPIKGIISQSSTASSTPTLSSPTAGSVFGPIKVSSVGQSYDQTGLMADLFALAERQINSVNPQANGNSGVQAIDLTGNELERYPNKHPTTSSVVQSHPGVLVTSKAATANSNKRMSASAATAAAQLPPAPVDDDDSKFLLSNMPELELTENESEQSAIGKSLFVQELLLSLLASEPCSDAGEASTSATVDIAGPAVAVECKLAAAPEQRLTLSEDVMASTSATMGGVERVSKKKLTVGSSRAKASGASSHHNPSSEVTSGRAQRVSRDHSSSSMRPQPSAESVAPNGCDEAKDDDERPPSPTPAVAQQHRSVGAMRLPNRLFGASSSGPVRIGRHVSSAAGGGGGPLNEFNQDEVSSLAKHVR